MSLAVLENISSSHVILAFLLTLLAGLSTGIGGAIAFFAKRVNLKLLTFGLGFSAGVMIYISFVEILPEADEYIAAGTSSAAAEWFTVLAFFGGIAFIGIIDRLVPSYENPHELPPAEEMKHPESGPPLHHLHRAGVKTALAIAIHNFPEGLVTFMAALSDIRLGIAIAIAIAIHNVPEGIAVSIPIYYASGSRRRAFGYSFIAGLAEPAGALIGYVLLYRFLTDTVLGVVFAGVAGIMVFISLDELLPAAERYGQHHLNIYGLIAGMAVMAFSLLLL